MSAVRQYYFPYPCSLLPVWARNVAIEIAQVNKVLEAVSQNCHFNEDYSDWN